MSTFKLLSAPKRLLEKILKHRGRKILRGNLFYVDVRSIKRPQYKAYGDYACSKHKYFDRYCPDCQKHSTYSP